jgi:putative transcriptional regulator
MNISSGDLIIAAPFMDDPFFKKTAVLLADYSSTGSLGFIMNRITNLKLADLLEDIHFDSPVFYGGPVGNESVYYMHNLGNRVQGSAVIMPGLFWGGDFEALKTLLNTGLASEDSVRFFAGYAGWEPGQLEAEFEAKSWALDRVGSDQLLEIPHGDDFWRRRIKRNKDYALWSNFTDTPHLN